MARSTAQSKASRPAVGELALIQRIQRIAQAGSTSSPALRLGIGDDCAVLRPGRKQDVVVTTDFSLEGRHFRRDWHSPEAIGHRTLARGLSDLAAMGAKPTAAFLSLALPVSLARDRRWTDRFFTGLLRLADRCRVPLAGGDTSQAPTEHMLADIVLLGSVPQGRALRRDTARAGDRLYVTGFLGGAAVELDAIASGRLQARDLRDGSSTQHPHLFPEPRLRVGRYLSSKRLASAAMDISDGLSSDLLHLCQASGLSADVYAERLPLFPSSLGRGEPQGGQEALHAALHGGEDYELLFASSPRVKVPRRIGGVSITEIGGLSAPAQPSRPRVFLTDSNGHRSALKPQGWEHLR